MCGSVWLAPQSQLQFIHSDHAAEIVWSLIEKGVKNEIVNLGAQGMVRLKDIHAKSRSSSVFKDEAPYVSYELSTKKLLSLYGKPLAKTQDEVFSFVESITNPS